MRIIPDRLRPARGHGFIAHPPGEHAFIDARQYRARPFFARAAPGTPDAPPTPSLAEADPAHPDRRGLVERPMPHLATRRALGPDPVLAVRAGDHPDLTAVLDIEEHGVADVPPAGVEAGRARR